MWKRLMIALFMLLSAFSVGYAYYNIRLNAVQTAYLAGGTVSGRINQSPSNLSVNNAGMQKGDRILMGVENPFDGDPMAWILSNFINNYTDYDDNGCSTTWTNICSSTTPKSAWFVQSDRKIAYLSSGLTTSDFTMGKYDAVGYPNYLYATYGQTSLVNEIDNLNTMIKNSVRDDRLLAERDLKFLVDKKTICDAGPSDTASCDTTLYSGFYTNNETGKKVFTIGQGERSDSDKSFSESYYSNAFIYSVRYSLIYVNYSYDAAGNFGIPVSINADLALRPSAYFDLSDVVFSLSKGTTTSIGNVTQGSLTGHTNVYNAGINCKPMKLRMYNSAMTAQLNNAKNVNGNNINQITKDKTINLEVDANAGNDGYGGVYTVSALVFDQKGDFAYYKPLENAKGSGLYEFDLTGIPVGKYKIAVVNEAYDENSTAPADSSAISDVLPLEIVEPVSIKTTAKTGLEYSKNVNQNDTVATYIVSNGADPITVTMASDSSVSGHENDYQLFAVSNDKVIVNDLSGLNAGDYYFKLNAVDSNGDPNGGVNSSTVHIIVAKTNTSIVFDDPNQTKKSVTDAATSWNETASASPSDGVKVTYSKVGGDISLIDIDPDSGAITYKGNGSYGKVKIRATADDDPNTGNDNYNSAYVEKEIVVYAQVDGSVTPDPKSSDANVPTFTANDANVKIGGTIGTIKGEPGTPDDVSGSKITYTYGIKSDGNGSFFAVNPSTGVITTKANLGVDTYHITVTVSDKWSTKEIPVTINVGLAKAENLQYYENKTSSTVINTKTVNFTDKNVEVFATVKGSSNSNPVKYEIKDGSTNVIEVNSTSGAVTIRGTGTVTIVATKKGASGQADARAELTFTVTAGAQNFIYTTDSTLSKEMPKNSSTGKYNTYEKTYEPSGTFNVYTTGNPSGTTVTYRLKAGSNTDVISVDSDGTVHILNASRSADIGHVTIEAISHDPSGNYSDKMIELPITIKKGTRKVEFADDPVYVVNGTGSVTPIIKVDGSPDTEGTAVIEVDVNQSSIAWTNNGKEIQYSYSGDDGKDIKLQVSLPGNRNYENAEGKGTLHILGTNEAMLTVSTPGKINYGDHFTIRSTQDDSMSENVKYTFTVDNTIFVSNPDVNGNAAEFDALKYSGNSEVTIRVTRTADGEVPLSKTVKIKVLPKDINIIVDDKMKQKGEENPELTFQDFTSQLVRWNGVQDVVDLDDVVLSTTATTTSKAGSYPITGNTKTMNTTYPNYNFIFKEGKLMVDSNVDKDVDGDGKPDFNDPDGDGCPDLNIKWKDDSGNWVVINGDRDYDGIPDLNIDSDGDGIPDLNIDTDTDGKPDINLVILKKTDWKPTKCVVQSATVKEEYCTGTNAKPQINVDTDNDNIPNINIDTNGDMKADINIDINKDNIADVNLNTIETWKPNKDYKHQNFLYDTMDTIKPYLNIDTNGDNCPDINLDMDQDGIADLNIDTDDDQIPNVNIDSTGSGKADMNLDTNDDGIPDENIIEITEWKPDKKVGNICTMIIQQNTELEDNGVKVEKPDGTSFLPNFALKVEDVTNIKQTEITTDAKELIEEKQEVKKVYDVKLLKDGVEVKPDGMIKVKIPYEGINNPILIRKNNHGSYEKIHYTIEQGYLVYETEELGIVSIIGDKETNTSVMGTYTPNIGGALTGDETCIHLNLLLMFISFLVLMILKSNKQKDTFQ